MFCSFCGSKNPDEGKYCFSCGKPLVTGASTEQNQIGINTHKLTIFRVSQMFLMNPPINIQINGKLSQTIANGETLYLKLEEGLYNIEFSQSFRKRAVEINFTSDMQITVKWNRMTGAINTTINY